MIYRSLPLPFEEPEKITMAPWCLDGCLRVEFFLDILKMTTFFAINMIMLVVVLVDMNVELILN